MCVCVYIYTLVHIYTHMCVYIYTLVHIYTHMCVYVYIYTLVPRWHSGKEPTCQ